MTNREHRRLPSLALLRLQSWLSPAFPAGFYSYSHGLEWAVEARDVYDRQSLVDWLDSDLRHGSGRNEAIFFKEAWLYATKNDQKGLGEISELAAAFRGTSELALESSQPAQGGIASFPSELHREFGHGRRSPDSSGSDGRAACDRRA
jgi:urease accessory protein